MYVSGWDGQLWALDATNGQELWRYRHASPFDVSLCCGNVNRGVAVAEGKVFMTTLNAHIIALDAETGKKVWDQTYGDVRAGESATVAPLIVKDMVIVGSSGGEFGSRGHTDAFKLATGERVWRCYMIPKPGEPGSDTWPDDGEAWQRGGANCWITPSYDPDLNLLYYGTGNPCPDFDGGVRDVRELRAIGLPIWARAISASGTTKGGPGWVNVPVVAAGATVRPGDLVVADDDGVVVVPAGAASGVLAKARDRAAREADLLKRINAGDVPPLSDDLRRQLTELGVSRIPVG